MNAVSPGTVSPVLDAAPTTAQPAAAEPMSASEKTLLVLEAALHHRRFSGVVEATGLAKATAHRIVHTLVDRGWVTLDEDGSYLPGPMLLSLAGQALQRVDISAIAAPFVHDLVERVHCTVHVGVVNGDEIIYLVRTDSDKPYRMPSRVGLSVPMTTTGIGKVVLAGFGGEDLDRFLRRVELPARTPHSITDPHALRAEVALVRERGYSLDREENVPGVACVAAPIRDHTGTVKYGLSISTLTLEHSLEEVEAMAPEAVATADAISRALGWNPA